MCMPTAAGTPPSRAEAAASSAAKNIPGGPSGGKLKLVGVVDIVNLGFGFLTTATLCIRNSLRGAGAHTCVAR